MPSKKPKIKLPKIPKQLKKLTGTEGRKIELRYPLTGNMVAAEALPVFDINLAGSKSSLYLGNVGVLRDSKEGGYVVRYWLDGADRKRNVLAKTSDLGEARTLAYRTARELSEKIAGVNKLDLSDRADEDEDELEKTILGVKLDALPYGGKMSAFLLLFVGGIALSMSQISLTGNAVSNLTSSTPGLLGVFLFIAGLVGMILSFRKGK